MNDEMRNVPPPPFIFPNNMPHVHNGGYAMPIPQQMLIMNAGQTQRQNSAPALITVPNLFNPHSGVPTSHSNPGSPMGMGPVLFVDTNVQSPSKKGGFYVQHFLQNEKKYSPRKRASSDPSIITGNMSPISAGGSSSKVRKKRSCTRWTEDENKKLIEAYVKYEGKNWSAIAKAVGNKTSDQCNQHWHRVLNPAISKKPWTDDEDNQLVARVNEYGESSWKKISEGLRGRTDLQCRHRWTQIKKTISKGGKMSNSPGGSPIPLKPLHINTDDYSSNSSSPTGTPNTPTPLSGRVYNIYGTQYKAESPSPSQQIDPNNFYPEVPVHGYNYPTQPPTQPMMAHPGIMVMEERTGKIGYVNGHQIIDRSTPLANYDHDDLFLENPTGNSQHAHNTGYVENIEGNVVNFLKLDFFGNDSQHQQQQFYQQGLPPASHMYGSPQQLRQAHEYIQPNQNRAPIPTMYGQQQQMYNSAFFPMTTAFDQNVLHDNSSNQSSTPPPQLFPGAGNGNSGPAGSAIKSEEHSPLGSQLMDHSHMDFNQTMESFQHSGSLFDSHRLSPPTLPPLPSISSNEYGYALQNTSPYPMRSMQHE
jgi:hypothetical protein